MRVREQFLQSKRSTVPDDGGEDGIVVTEHFAAVIDGATAKTPTLYQHDGDRIAPGKLAMRLVKDAVTQLDPAMDGHAICNVLNRTLYDYYARHDLVDIVRDNPLERATVSIALYNARQNTLMLAGDCQAVVVDLNTATHHQNLKQIDTINAQARADELERLLAAGDITLEHLLVLSPDQDPGRRHIMHPPAGAGFPGLTGQREHQNNPHSLYRYFALDGFADTTLPGFSVLALAETAREIVLASDGYAPGAEHLCTLQTAEDYLARLVADDPLCFRLNKGTKGKGHNVSFDDRAYIRLTL